MSQQEHISTELLIDYVDGILGSDARKKVEDAIRSDENTAGVVAGIRAYYDKHGQNRESLEKWLEDGKQENITAAKQAKVRSIKLWPKVLVAVAAAAILVFAFIGLQDSRHSVALDYAALPVEVNFETRSNGDLSAMMSAFDKKEFTKVLELSEGDFEDSAQLNFMIGLSYFKTEDYQMAVAYLTDLDESRLAEYANWYIALSYAITEQDERANRAMQAIETGNGKYASNAQAWLELPQD